MKKLPNKPSTLIRLALNDLIACEDDENYTIEMNVWHSRYADSLNSKSTCHVCFGGAIMAKTLKSDLDDILSPGDFKIGKERKLYSLDLFRQGEIKWGLEKFYGKRIEIGRMKKRMVKEITPYSTDPKMFKSGMNRLADYLEKYGF